MAQPRILAMGLLSGARALWYNNGIDAVMIRFEVVFLAADAATEKHDK